MNNTLYYNCVDMDWSTNLKLIRQIPGNQMFQDGFFFFINIGDCYL